jgi:hypothetical protein
MVRCVSVVRTYSSALFRADRSRGVRAGWMRAWNSKTRRWGDYLKSMPTTSGAAAVRSKRSVVRLEAVGAFNGQKYLTSCSLVSKEIAGHKVIESRQFDRFDRLKVEWKEEPALR